VTSRPYAAAFAAGVRRSAAGRAELVVRIGFYAVILVVFASLWRAAAQANEGNIAGYDFRSLIWYVVAAEAAVVATKPRMIEEIGDDIGTGAIAIEMLRPVSVVMFRMAAEMGEAIVRLACAALCGGVLITLFVAPPPSFTALLFSIPALVLAVACNLAAQHLFASAAFWIADAKASWFLYQKLVFLLGGMLLPLELLPEPLARTARALPFWVTAYVPGRFLSGHIEPGLLLVQLAWLTVLPLGALFLFQAGERRLQIAGG
jgi:ABC-2 type transport system permease protein